MYFRSCDLKNKPVFSAPVLLDSEFGLLALFVISLKRLERFFKSLHIIFIMYILMSETFIKIDLLQHLEISRQTYPTNRSKIRATTLTVLKSC